MQISTHQLYDRSTKAMQGLSARADTLQTQLSSQKRILAPSDDPVAYQRLQNIARATANDDVYAKNLTLAGSVLQQADTTLGSIQTQLQRASELAVRANNDTLNDADRQAIGTELAGLAETIAGLINTRDVRGQPLFGSADGGDAAIRQPNGSYALATTTSAAIPVADGQSVQTSETAARVLGANGSDALTMISTLAAALRSGSPGNATATAITDLAAASNQISDVRGSVGVRGARIDLMQSAITDAGADREVARAAIDGFDYASTITELQQTMTVLSATQASFSKLSALSLFNYLR